MNKKSALGRGLDSLIPMDDYRPLGTTSSINEIPLNKITVNPNQPRKLFDDNTLADLAESIKTFGLVQPITLRKISDDTYQLISGERRFRAAKLAGLESLPAYIRTVSDSELTELALIENIQREDLNPIEIALTFKKLIEQYNLTQEKLSERIGKNRATIANFIRLLNLHAKVQLGLQNREIDMGHARALLPVDDPALQLKVYQRILKEGLSVRKVEELVKNILAGNAEKLIAEKKYNPSADYDILQKHLSSTFKTNVKLKLDASGKGRITISFKDDQELERLISMFDSMSSQGEN